MNKHTELTRIILDFRRLSSNLLNSGIDNCDVCLSRLMKYIEDTWFICNTIHGVIDDVDFDFKECFLIEGAGWHGINIPEDESCHLKAQYDYMHYILDEPRKSVSGEAILFPHSGKRWVDIIQDFLNDTIKPMINYIDDAISKEMMIVEEETKMTEPMMNQSIGTVNGTVIQQGSGIITTTNTNGTDVSTILTLINRIIPSLNAIPNASQDDIDSIKDDLESVEEQLKSSSPKKSRLQKALGGIKKFANDFSMNLAVTLASGAVTGMDWNTLIQRIEQFISGLVH